MLFLSPNLCGKWVHVGNVGTSEVNSKGALPRGPTSQGSSWIFALKELSRNHTLLWHPGKAQRSFNNHILLETLGRGVGVGGGAQEAAGCKSCSFIHSAKIDLSIRECAHREWDRHHP